MMNWSEQIAIITGASSGIGAATAMALAATGAKVVLLARSNDHLAAVAATCRVRGAADVLLAECDIRAESQVEQAIQQALERFGRIDILINSAGLSLNGEVDGYSLSDWQTVLETNLTGTFLTCRAVLPAMKRQQSGQIINIASGAGRNGIKSMSAYCAAKFGVIGFTESLALEVRAQNIRVATLLPGSVATNFSRTANRQSTDAATLSPPRDIGYALTADEIAQVLLSMLAQPPQVWMSEVVVRPLNTTLNRTIN